MDRQQYFIPHQKTSEGAPPPQINDREPERA